MKYPVSVIVITRNEERMIYDCLESVQWAEDIIVVDANSNDRTVEISKEFTSRIFQKEWTGYVSAKQFGLEQAKHEWILWLDADERVTEDLALEICNVVSNKSVSLGVYKIPRRAYFLGKWIRHCGWYPGYVLRLFRKEMVCFTTARVHERLEADTPVGRLGHDLLHYTDDNLYHYFFKLNRYTSLAAEDYRDSTRRFSLADIMLRPPFLFLKMYLLKRGFLDGMHGLILSALSAAYVFSKYAKIWESEKNPSFPNLDYQD